MKDYLQLKEQSVKSLMNLSKKEVQKLEVKETIKEEEY